MRKLFNDDTGFIISAELILVLTIGVLGMVVGLASLRDSLSSELVDLSNAFGAVSQTYSLNTLQKTKTTGTHGSISGFGFNDRGDDCDCIGLAITSVVGKNDGTCNGGTTNEDNGNP